MRVSLGHAKAGVSEYLRNSHNVGSGSCEFRCGGVTKVVKVEIVNACEFASLLKTLLDFHPTSSSSRADKDILTFTRLLTQQLAHNLIHWNDPVAVCLRLPDTNQPAI